MNINFVVQKNGTELQWLNHKTSGKNTKLQQVHALSCNIIYISLYICAQYLFLLTGDRE